MELLLSTKGTTLSSRIEGSEIREEIIKYIKDKDISILYIDFKDIIRITQSFADEVFGKIFYSITLDEFKTKVKIINASEEIRKVIKYSIRLRTTKNS